MSTPVTPSPQHGLPATRSQLPALSTRAPAEAPGGTPAGWLLLLVPALIFLAEPFFVSHSYVGRESSFRDAPFGLLIGLAGLWIAVNPGRKTFAAVLAGLGGVGLLFGAVFAPHAYVGVTFTEAFCGVFAVLVAAMVGVASASK